MKKYISSCVLYLACGLSFLLSGCLGSATPNCGDGDTLEVLNEMVEETFGEVFHPTGFLASSQKSYPHFYRRTTESFRALVDIEIRSIQTLRYEQDTDRYTCGAVLEFSQKANPDAKVVSSEIKYQVYAIEDPESSFEIRTSGLEQAISKDLLVAFVSRWDGPWE